MPRFAYVDGRFVPHSRAVTHIEDRGYQFADAVYEVIAFIGDRMVDEDLHFGRLERSLKEIRMKMPFSHRHFQAKFHVLRRRNRLQQGSLYLQVSRGVARRDHRLPPPDTSAVVVMTVSPFRQPTPEMLRSGVRVITVPDRRWDRPDIKGTALLPNILAKDDAVRADCYEAFLYDEQGQITEGSSTNAWIIDRGGTVVTRPADGSILNGVTRRALMGRIAELGLAVSERTFSVDELRNAREAFLTSTTAMVLPVTGVDDVEIGDGRPGPKVGALMSHYKDHFWRVC